MILNTENYEHKRFKLLLLRMLPDKSITLLLFTLMRNLLLEYHSLIEFIFDCNLEVIVCTSFPVSNIITSSAYIVITPDVIDCDMSFINSKNKIGASTPPWGTPTDNSFLAESLPCESTTCFLSYRYVDRGELSTTPCVGRPLSIHYKTCLSYTK